jgi:hypothetical protein
MQDYPYLGTSSILVAIALAIILAWRRQSVMLWATGGLCLPFALFSFEFIPKYWDPQVIAWLGIVSLEDLLFSSCTGVIALAIGLGAWRWHIEPTCRTKQIVPRYLLIFAIGVGLGYALKYTLPNPEVMTCTMVGLTASFIYMMAKRRDAWPIVVTGGIGFGVFYLLLIKVSLLVWPHFIHQWQPDVPLGYWWGVPVYEIVWSIGFGACWPLYMVFSLGIHNRAVPSCASPAGSQPSEALRVHPDS